MWWRKRPNKRIDKLLDALEGFDLDFSKLRTKVDELEQKFKSKWFPKKKNVEDILEGEPEDMKPKKEKPKDLRNDMFLPSERGIN